jgi:hypothetical protein
MEISKSFSVMYSIFGDLMPTAAKLFVLKLNGKDEEVSKILGETIASGKFELDQIEKLVQVLQMAHSSNSAVTWRNKHEKIEEILKTNPDLERIPNRATAEILGVGKSTIQRARLRLKNEQIKKISLKQGKDLYEEQLERALEMISTNLEFKSYSAGTVRIEGIPSNGIHRSPIVIDEHKTSREHKMGPKPLPKYDISPILSSIFHYKNTHGVSNKSELQKFSELISELKVFPTEIGKDRLRKKVAERILKIAYILNGECVMGLRTK